MVSLHIFSTIFKTIYITTKNLIIYAYNKNYVSAVNNTLIELSRINIFYTKLLQWISDNNINNEEINNCIKKFTNNVEYNNDDIDYDSLLSLNLIAYNNGDNLIITDIKPINSGTISLVFKGLLNEKPIVIKLLRKNIDKKLNEAIDLFLYIGKISKYIYILNNFNLYKIISNNIKSLLDQLNFIKEVDNLNIFYNSHIKSNNIIIPKVYKYFTENNNKLIVMDYLSGKHINDLHIDEKEDYCNVWLKTYMLNNFKYGIVHGDLHPGNIIFLENNVIGYIDFGIIYKLNIEQQNFLYTFYNNLAQKKYNNLLDDIFDINTIDLYFNIDNKTDLEKIIESAKNEILNKIDNNELFKNNNFNNTDILILIKILNKYEIDFNEFISNVLLTAASGLGFISKLTSQKFNDKISDTFKNFKSKISYDI
jgi:predicted unusual protein kinase regulating ubiquinone biosynthesis (AarF/ABC1/UbiB family)